MSSKLKSSVTEERQVKSGRMEARAASGENASLEEEIRCRAYEIYLERGELRGSELDDWLQAEQELCSGGSPNEMPKFEV